MLRPVTDSFLRVIAPYHSARQVIRVGTCGVSPRSLGVVTAAMGVQTRGRVLRSGPDPTTDVWSPRDGYRGVIDGLVRVHRTVDRVTVGICPGLLVGKGGRSPSLRPSSPTGEPRPLYRHGTFVGKGGRPLSLRASSPTGERPLLYRRGTHPCVPTPDDASSPRRCLVDPRGCEVPSRHSHVPTRTGVL